MSIFLIKKDVGETPLQALDRLKSELSEIPEAITYAGRLDPLASGLMIGLSDQDIEFKGDFLNLNKTYELEILLGYESDTYDLLGLSSKSSIVEISKQDLNKCLTKFLGRRDQSYPPYSSKTVLGQPLFSWARSGKLVKVIIPKKQIEIFNIKFISQRLILGEDLLAEIEKKINSVSGDFRQTEILATWRVNLNDRQEKFQVMKLEVHCSSGTYMRSLAHEIGQCLKTGGLALNIKRLEIGKYKLSDIPKDLWFSEAK